MPGGRRRGMGARGPTGASGPALGVGRCSPGNLPSGRHSDAGFALVCLSAIRQPASPQGIYVSTRQHAIAVTALLSGLLCATEVGAAPIIGVTASVSVPAGGGSDISHIVDGSGLFDGNSGLPIFTAGALHGRAAADSTFVSGGAVPVTTGSIVFGLGGVYALGGMAVWNFNGGDNTVGVKDVIVLG